MNQKGFTLTEILIASVCTLLAGISIAKISTNLLGSTQRTMKKAEAKADFMLATRWIRRFGRVAQGCTKNLLNGTNYFLTCNVQRPGQIAVSQMRVGLISGGLAIESMDLATGSWKTEIAFSHIVDFKLCDDSDMNTGACSLIPTKINTIHVETWPISAPRSGRFFRYQITLKVSQTNGTISNETHQSALFVRNPVVFAPELAYEW